MGMADGVDQKVLGSLTNLTINASAPTAEGVSKYPPSGPIDGSLHPTEIRNIAYHVQPPTVPSTRSTPLVNHEKRTDPFQFGSRYLEESDDVFAWNAWDHVDPSTDQLFVSYTESQYALQRENAASDFDRRRFNAEPAKWWDKFYGNNEANFFKDRKWLRQEFPVLSLATFPLGTETGTSETKALHAEGPWNVILEIGAGAGNTAFPLVKGNQNPALMIHACDFSARAVNLMLNSEHYTPKHLTASQWDMASPDLPPGIAAGTIDIVLMIFAFSALNPNQWTQTVKNVWDVLRPGGEVCFRDYGRGDLAQVRFRKNRWLGENFYVRGDGTRVYFFEDAEIRGIWGGKVAEVAKEAQEAPKIQENESDSKQGQQELQKPSAGNETTETRPTTSHAFEVLSLATDRRLIVNRQKQLKMYRCWQQARFRKPTSYQASMDTVPPTAPC